MLFIIGVYEEGNRIVALKIYDSTNRRLGMFYKRQVIDAVTKGNLSIAGIRKAIDRNGKVQYKFTSRIYGVRKLDKLDSAGNPIDGRHVRVPIYTEGFKDNMKITLVDSMGQLEKVTYEELLDLMQQGKVTGVMKSKVLLFSEWCEAYGLICAVKQ